MKQVTAIFRPIRLEAVEQALQGMERITEIVKSMKNFAYRDANSEKKPQDLNQAIKATTVVATNEWKYHADLQIDLDPDLHSRQFQLFLMR